MNDDSFSKILIENDSLYRKEDFSREVRDIIVASYKANIDVSCTLNPAFDKETVEEILSCVEDGINIKPFVFQGFSADQLRLIKKGLIKGIDVTQYAFPDWSCDKMNSRFEALTKATVMNEADYSIDSPHALNQLLGATIKKLAVF